MTKKRIAVIGLGKMGLFHLSILKNLPEIEIVGISDQNTSLKKMVHGMGFDVPFFDSMDELIQTARPEGIFACVPPGFNPSVAETCLKQGVALFLEKPMAASLSDARKILAALSSHPAPPANGIGYMMAHYPLCQQAKKLIEEGAIGEIRHYRGSILLGDVFKKQEGWRQNPAVSGGGVVSVVGSHLLFLIRFLLGLPEEISAQTIHLFSSVEDIAEGRFKHAGYFGEFYVSWSRPGYSDMALQLSLEGTHGFMELSDSMLSVHTFESHPSERPGSRVWYPWDFSKPQVLQQGIDLERPGYAAQDHDFVSSIGSGRAPLVSWKEGYEVQKMIEAVYHSQKQGGRPVSLKELE